MILEALYRKAMTANRSAVISACGIYRSRLAMARSVVLLRHENELGTNAAPRQSIGKKYRGDQLTFFANVLN